ncbi:hypothetical protein STCU_11509 [Strigomonas culicis]|uniref:Exoribonuclease phosphorolytic domain-containing protein n=1 Tax=Strigomonas culicis TaxID=28005 RepID=S9V080_9TRYP|nr:hypothetical protein STCU_11509 [Strigomonas culicis]|eukprot:EPY16165.1 hypothetical protein STCU_11509 [Strigomonas culicis]
MTCLLADGGLRAAALHATLAALRGLVLPRARLPDGGVVEPIPLRLTRVPVACTYGVVGGTAPGSPKLQLLADTSAIEEYIADGIVTIAVDEGNNIVHLQYGCPTPLSPSVLVACVRQWQQKAPAVRAAILQQ